MGGAAKIAVCLFFSFSFTSIVLSQDIYFVTFVKGEIKRANSANIKVGDKLAFQEKVIFSKKDGRLILLHPQKGRFVVEPGHGQPEPSGEYLIYLKNNLVPSNEKVKLSTRGDADLDEFFTVNTSISRSLLFIGESRVSLDNTKYRINDAGNDFFFLQYTPVSGKSSNNRLTVKNDSLRISNTDFLFNGREPTDSEEVKIGFIQNYSKEKKVTKISSFRPRFMGRDECKNIMKAIKASLGNNKEKVIAEAMTQLYYNFGKPDKNILNAIYDEL